jgi:CheY-like chemotaxis protein
MSRHILVVEDQADNRQIIRDMLAPTDYQITEAENGEQALAVVAKQRPDLILMDIQLPIMDGYEATPRIKADATLRSIPIIAVTSCNCRKRLLAILSLGNLVIGRGQHIANDLAIIRLVFDHQNALLMRPPLAVRR